MSIAPCSRPATLLQAQGSDVSADILDDLTVQNNSPDSGYTIFLPSEGQFNSVKFGAFSNEQRARILATHIAYGDYGLQTGFTGTIGTAGASNVAIDFSDPDNATVVVADVPGAPVATAQGEEDSCTGHIIFIDSVLVPQEVAGTPAAQRGLPEDLAAPPAPANRSGNSTCQPAVPAMRAAGGGGIVSAIELAVVSSCSCCTAH